MKPIIRISVLSVTAGVAIGALNGRAQTAPPSGHDQTMLQQFYQQRAFVNGQPVPTDIYDKALIQWRQMSRTVSRNTVPGVAAPGVQPGMVMSSVSAVKGTVWVPIGPSPIIDGGGNANNGRVAAIALNPYNPNVIYQGAEGGGVWRSINGGTTWTPLFDQQPSLGIGEPSAIAIDPQNTDTIYVGTSGRFVQNISKGILKSTDGGGSWIVLGSGFPAGNTGNAQLLFSGVNISAVRVDPANSSVVYLASDNGMFRSTDGGLNWTAGNNGFGVGQSLALDTTSPAANRILYAGINARGIFQSTDGGQNWTRILSAATPAVAAAVGTGGFGRLIVDLAPPTSPPHAGGIQVLYVTMEGTGAAPDPVGLFESTDQGGTWTKRTGTGLPGNTQGGFSMAMGVDPASPGDGANDIIYVGMVGYAKSVNSGNTFAALGGGMHVDFHSDFVFATQPSPTPSIVFAGNDGGIWKSLDGGANWSGASGSPLPTINAGGLQTALFYNLGIKYDATASVSEGALQDNGVPRTTGTMSWTESVGGDGFSIVFDPTTPNDAYMTSGFWGGCPAPGIPCSVMFQSTTSGSSWINAGSCSGWFSATIPFSEQDCITAVPGTHPIKVDPTDSKYVYYGGVQDLWQTVNGMGSSFRKISNGFGRPNAVDIAPGNANNVAAGVDGQVWLSTNAKAATVGPPSGVTFANITRNLPGRAVTRVAFDPIDPTVIYVVLSGTGGGHVFRTTIGGSTWTDISPPVDVSYNAIALDGTATPTIIYVGNDLGVMRSVDNGVSWAVLDDLHFPNVPVTDLALNVQAGVLRAATFGRGAFELAAATGPVIAINAENGLQFGPGCVGTPQRLLLQVFNVGTSDLTINSVARLMGSADFTVLPNPATPLVISPDAEVDFTVQYNPNLPGPQQATIRVASSDPGVPYFDLTATGSRADPTNATVIADSGNFGDVCLGSFKDLNLTIENKGLCTLVISGIGSTDPGEFLVPGVVSFPLTVQPGVSLQLPIRFQPSGPFGPRSATITITSNDPNHPSTTVSVSGNVPSGSIRVTGSTDFGNVCAGTLSDQTISICNVGKCNLTVTNVSFVPACPDFTLINNPFPAVLVPGSCLQLTIRLTPTSCGPKSCNLRIVSDDPGSPVINLTVTANTPCPSIDVPPDLGFEPEVITNIGPCSEQLPFPISNKGSCNLTITAITIGGTNAGDYSLVGLPSFPIILQPGDIVGAGDFKVAFAPAAVARARTATINITYVSDPITGATTTVTRKLCGEGVLTGARVLVMAGGVPLPVVDKIQLQRLTVNRSGDVTQQAPLVTVVPGAPCGPFQYHQEYGTVSNPVQLLAGDYQVTVSATINGKRKSLSASFSLNTCDFNPTVVINF